jgi:hypothetical protein
VGSSYTVQISPVVTGPLGTSQPVSWQFQTAVPAIQSRTPAAGDADVSVLDPALRAVFDNAVDEAALRATGSVRLLREGDAVPIDEPVYNPDTRTLTFRPSGGLRAGAPYQVVIAAAVAGPRAAGDFRWGFATRVPAIASTVPPDGGVIPAGLRRLEVVFTNPVDADLVVGRNFSVTKGGEQLELADEFLYDIGTLTVSLPPIDFESGAAYEAVIRPQLLGSRSADRPPPQPWRFTTEIPAVIGSEPEAGAEGVALSTATIQILFSGRIASRDASGFQLASRSLADIGQDAGDIPFEEVQITGFGTNPSLSVVNFAPVGGFRPFTEYRVSVDREVLGELADADSSWVFSTAARIADPSQGETVSNAEGTLALFFPPNSLQGGNGEVAIRVADITGASVAGGKLVAQDGAVSLVGQAYEVDVGNAVVRKPVSLILSYTEADLGVRDPTRLGVFTLAGSELERVGGTADPAEKVVRTTVEELGIFALFEDLTVGLGSAAIQDIDCQPRAFTPLGGSLSSETDISFALTGPADVTVRVYNASGRLERVILRDTPMTPGRNSLPWDGRDEDEDIVASGLYIVVVSAGDEQAEKVVAVVR